ncbi:MAG: ABC transporter ATP-binding protein [Candidatus Ranarchaeia archaeon]|jgi:putative ABC transport system ATP-binding protein
MSDQRAMIQATDLNREYRRGREIVHAIKNVNLNIKEGEFFVVEGPSGCGKTTLLNVLSGLDRPTSGRVIVDGMDNTDEKFDEKVLPSIRRRKIGFVFQSFNLLRNLTGAENVEAALWPSDIPYKEIEQRATEVIRYVDLVERRDHTPNQLSGGEQQRFAIARALVNNPKIVFADEPTGNLDTKTGESIMKLLRELNKRENITFVVVTHDHELIKFADRVARMKDGRIVSVDRR